MAISLDNNGNITGGIDNAISSKFALKQHTHLISDVAGLSEKINEEILPILSLFSKNFTEEILGGVTDEANNFKKLYDLLLLIQSSSFNISETIYTDEEKTSIRNNIDVFSKVESDERYIKDLNYVHTDENFTLEDKANLTNLKKGVSGYQKVDNFVYNKDYKLVSFKGDGVLTQIEYNEDGLISRVFSGSEEDIYIYDEAGNIESITNNML